AALADDLAHVLARDPQREADPAPPLLAGDLDAPRIVDEPLDQKPQQILELPHASLLEDPGDLEQLAHLVGGLGALGEPLPRLLGVYLYVRGVGARVVGADP